MADKNVPIIELKFTPDMYRIVMEGLGFVQTRYGKPVIEDLERQVKEIEEAKKGPTVAADVADE